MASFNFPDNPTNNQEVVNDLTGVIYKYNAADQSWHVVGSGVSSELALDIEQLQTDLLAANNQIVAALDERTTLLEQAAQKNASQDILINENNSKDLEQDVVISEIDARLDAISHSLGVLEFKGRYTYVLEKTEAMCQAAYAECLLQANGDPPAVSECTRIGDACLAAIGTPLAQGTFTSIGDTVLADVNELVITNTTNEGETFNWSNLVDIGDYIEMVEHPASDSTLYEVIADPNQRANECVILVKFIQESGTGDGEFNAQTNYEIRVFKKDQGLDLGDADLRYVRRPYTVLFSDTAPTTGDDPDGLLRNGELWYDTQALQLFVYLNNTWVTAASPNSQDIVVANVESKVAALEAQPKILSSASAPENPQEGDIWFNPTNLRFAFYASGGWVNPDQS